ncbi:hypothetical protein [Streptomyces roseoverticillatus]|uniref:Secreted protein n=1 Tax=Streptomyces roseoverticillatus TaxID=66429 RepID=A0ABV3INV1_9ACTN
MNGTSRRTKKALVIAAITAMAGAGALAAAGTAAADDHLTDATSSALVQVAHPIGGDDHGTGGRDDHGTGGRDDHGTIWAGPDAAAATR